jgi:hypothetical protein
MPLSDILQQPIRDDRQLGRPIEARSSYISRGRRHALKHITMLDLRAKEMTEEFGMKDNQ